jgi:hypothetical protein
MSYILQGSGALLGPCLGNLLGREVARHAPCVCLRCAQLLSTSLPSSQPLAAAAQRPRIAAGSGPDFVELGDRAFFQAAGSPFLQHYRAASDGLSRLLPDAATRTAAGLQEGPVGSSELRRRFPTAAFQQKYFTNFRTPLPYLGHTGPINVNLTFLCDPGVSHTGWWIRFFL